MVSLRTAITSLSRPRQFVFGGAVLILFSVFMPWHSIGIAALGTEHAYNGFGDQNLIIGLIVFAFALVAVLINLLPVFGVRVPHFRFSDGTLFTFFGGESSLLVFVLMIMHATSLVRAVNYDLRLGIDLALIGSAFMFLGGYLLRIEEKRAHVGHHEPLVRQPRIHGMEHDLHVPRKVDTTREDGRMKLDI